MYSSLTVISCRVINWYNVNIPSILDLYNISVSEWESDQNQNELYWTGIFTHIVIEAPQRNRMTVTGQDTDNKRTIYKYTIRQCTKWQKPNVQYRQLCVRSDVQIWNEKNKCVCWINICIIVLCVPCLMSSVHEIDCLGKKTVSLSGRSGAQSSVASTRQ